MPWKLRELKKNTEEEEEFDGPQNIDGKFLWWSKKLDFMHLR